MILLCYDGSPDAQAAIDRARDFIPGGPATVLTVWEPFGEVLARSGAGIDFTRYDDIAAIDAASADSAQKRAAEGVERARDAGFDAQPQTRRATSTVAEAILSEADERDVHAVVVGARGLRGTKPPLLGGVSRTVTEHADRPVIVVSSPRRRQ